MYGMYGFDDGGVDRSGFAEKSAAAQGREDKAKRAFLELKAEERAEIRAHGRTTYDLLQPSMHLTQACYRSFRQFVKGHPGWDCKRVKATDEQKREFKEKRSCSVYFVNAIYDPAKA